MSWSALWPTREADGWDLAVTRSNLEESRTTAVAMATARSCDWCLIMVSTLRS